MNNLYLVALIIHIILSYLLLRKKLRSRLFRKGIIMSFELCLSMTIALYIQLQTHLYLYGTMTIPCISMGIKTVGLSYKLL